MPKLDKFNVSLDEMLKQNTTLTKEAKKEADVSVLMEEIDKLDYTDKQLEEGLNIYKKLLDGIKDNKEVEIYLDKMGEGNFKNISQVQEWLELYYKKLINNEKVSAAAEIDSDRKKEYTRFLKGFRLLGEVIQKKELEPIQLIGNICTIADLNGVCASGWKYALTELITSYRDDIRIKGIMDGVYKLEYKDKELQTSIEVYKKVIEKIKDDKKVQNYLKDEDSDIELIELNLEGLYNKLINNELMPKLKGDNQEQYNKTILKGLKLFSEYMEKKDVNLQDMAKNLIKLSNLNVYNNEETVRETVTYLLAQFPEEINKNLCNEMRISEEKDKIKIRLNGLFFAARDNVSKKLCYDFLNQVGIHYSLRPHYVDIYTKCLNKEYGLNLPELDVTDSYVMEGSEGYNKIESQFKEYLRDKDIENLIINDVCKQYATILNEESKIRQEARDEVTDWASLYITKNQLVGEVDDVSDFLMQCGYDDTLTKVRLKFIEEVLVENGYIKRENRKLTKEQKKDVMIRALNYAQRDGELEDVKNSIMRILQRKSMSKEEVCDVLLCSDKAKESLDILVNVITNVEQVKEVNKHDIYISIKDLMKCVGLEDFNEFEKIELLMRAIQNKDLEGINFLQQKGITLNNEEAVVVLRKAIESDNLKDIKTLLLNGVNINKNDLYGNELEIILIKACESSEKELVKFLINKGADVNKSISKETPLIKAVETGNKEIIKLLIESGADVNKGVPIKKAIEKGNKEIVKLLLENGADVNKKEKYGDFLLIDAVKKGNIDIIKMLIENGIDLNNGFALGKAIENKNKEVVELLIESGADVNKEDRFENCPLDILVKKWNKKMIQLLLDNGADVNRGFALNEAINRGNKSIVKLLIEKGADVNKELALENAIEKGNKAIVKLLLDNGADINKAFLISRAIEKGNKKIVKLLLQKDVNIRKDILLASQILEKATYLNQISSKSVEIDNKEIMEYLSNRINVTTEEISNLVFVAKSMPQILEAVIEQNDKEMLQMLIDNGVDINIKDVNGNVALNKAIEKGNKEIVELLIEKGADINVKTRYGKSFLNKAIEIGDKELIELLIEKGADVKKCELDKFIKQGNKEMIKLLIEKGVDVNKESSYGSIPLNKAIEEGNIEIVKLLLDKGADVNKEGLYGDAPQDKAIKGGNIEIIKLLIERGANINKKLSLNKVIETGNKEILKLLLENNVKANQRYEDEEVPINTAIKKGNTELVELLTKHGANVNIKYKNGDVPLNEAIYKGYDKIAKLLIDNKADVNMKDEYGMCSLSLAIARGNLEIIELLIKNGADVNSGLSTAIKLGDKEIINLLLENKADVNKGLIKSIEEGNSEIAKLLLENRADANKGLIKCIEMNNKEILGLLLEQGADVNITDTSGYSPLNTAIKKGNKEIVKVLIKNRANLNNPDESGKIPLNKAIEKEDKEIVRLLINKGVDVNKEDTNGFTPLMFACNKGNEEMVKLLLENKVDVNKQNKCGITALMIGCKKYLKHVTKILISGGADVNKQNKDGKTALMIACENRDKGIAKLLLKKGASVNKQDKDGKTALMIACENKDLEIAKMLIKNGAKVEELERVKNDDSKEFVEGLLNENMPKRSNSSIDIAHIKETYTQAKGFLKEVKQGIRNESQDSINTIEREGKQRKIGLIDRMSGRKKEKGKDITFLE